MGFEGFGLSSETKTLNQAAGSTQVAVQAVCAIGASFGLPELDKECEVRILRATDMGVAGNRVFVLGISIMRVMVY